MGAVRLTRLAAATVLALAVALVGTSCTTRGSATGSGPGKSGRVAASTSTAPAPIPRTGGNLVVGTEAESDGLDPTRNLWDATGYLYAAAVYDPLAAVAGDGTIKPYLAQSITANADFTTWTITLRPNVSFSDGEPLDAGAVVNDLDAQKASKLFGPALAAIGSITRVDAATVAVAMATPWVSFPAMLTTQVGYMASPRQLAGVSTSAHSPIGTGPFVLTDWVPGNHLTARKNPNYWRRGLPYLDSIEFRAIPDSQAREASLKAGTVDVFPTADPQTVLDFRGSAFRTYEQTKGRVEVGLVMLNVTKPPLDDPRVRQALAYATDTARYNTLANNGILKPASGPFSSGSGYANDPGYPTFDLNKAEQLLAAYEKDKGVARVSFQLTTTTGPDNATAAQVIAAMWRQAGVDVTVAQMDQSQLIGSALAGSYSAVVWRQFGEADPDLDYLWWHSGSATAALSTNMARNSDPMIDADLALGRSALDPAARKSAYEDITARLNKDLPYVWTDEVVWDVVAKPAVQGIDRSTLPDGTPQRAPSSGVFSLSSVWLDQ